MAALYKEGDSTNPNGTAQCPESRGRAEIRTERALHRFVNGRSYRALPTGEEESITINPAPIALPSSSKRTDSDTWGAGIGSAVWAEELLQHGR